MLPPSVSVLLLPFNSLTACPRVLCSPHQIWSPPSYATAQILHELPAVTMRTRHLSARTKLKCNRHFTIIIMRHSLMFLQRLLLIFFITFLFTSVCLPTSHYPLFIFCTFSWWFHLNSSVVVFFFKLFFAASAIGTPERTLSPNHRCRSVAWVAPVSVLCWCVCGSRQQPLGPPENIGHHHHHYQRLLTNAAKFSND